MRQLTVVTLFTACVMPALALAQVFHYEGMCEASAGFLLEEDRFAAVSDETNNITPKKDVFHIYDRGRGTPTIDPLPVLPVKTSDIEAATRIGTKVYFLTSHSLNSKNEDKPKRKHLFTLSLDNLSASEAGVDFIYLRERIGNVIEATTGIKSENLATRLNIEGLAATSDDRLLVGLREPLAPATLPSERRALVIDIGSASNIEQKQLHDLSASDVYSLPLGGRGIRSMERVGERFLIIAGAVHASDDDHREDFGKYEADLDSVLYWWDGHSDVALPVDFKVDLSVLKQASPEGLVILSENEVMILGDNGSDLCSDEETEVGARSFPTVAVSF